MAEEEHPLRISTDGSPDVFKLQLQQAGPSTIGPLLGAQPGIVASQQTLLSGQQTISLPDPSLQHSSPPMQKQSSSHMQHPNCSPSLHQQSSSSPSLQQESSGSCPMQQSRSSSLQHSLPTAEQAPGGLQTPMYPWPDPSSLEPTTQLTQDLPEQRAGPLVASVCDFSCQRPDGQLLFQDLNFQVHAGQAYTFTSHIADVSCLVSHHSHLGASSVMPL